MKPELNRLFADRSVRQTRENSLSKRTRGANWEAIESNLIAISGKPGFPRHPVQGGSEPDQRLSVETYSENQSTAPARRSPDLKKDEENPAVLQEKNTGAVAHRSMGFRGLDIGKRRPLKGLIYYGTKGLVLKNVPTER